MAAWIILATYAFFPSLSLHGIHGRSIFAQQEVIITKTQKGRIFDCVDFYKQLAFTHPSLKNLTSEVRPSLLWNQQRTSTKIGLEDGGCPSGTVPILRAGGNNTVEIFSHHHHRPQERCVAVVHTLPGSKKFLGSTAAITLYKPTVGTYQWSAARIKLINDLDSVEAGWMVNPSLFNDNEAHLYARFTAGGTGCFNSQCPGFVQVSTDIPLGVKPDEYSVVDGDQHFWSISIDKRSDGWWMSIDADKKPIGYWPNKLFTTLTKVASQVEWGGENNNPGPNQQIPEMGSGNKADYNTKKSACFAFITVVDENSEIVPPDQNTKKVWDCEDLYTVNDGGDRFPDIGRVVFYGGDH